MKRIAFIFSLVGCLIALAGCTSKPHLTESYYLYNSQTRTTQILTGFKTNLNGKYYRGGSEKAGYILIEDDKVTWVEKFYTGIGEEYNEQKYVYEHIIRLTENIIQCMRNGDELVLYVDGDNVYILHGYNPYTKLN